MLQIFFNKEITSPQEGVQKGEAVKMEVYPDSVKFSYGGEEVVFDM